MASVSLSAISETSKSCADSTQNYCFPFFDMYSRPIHLLVRPNMQYYTSFCGTIASFITFIALFSYIGY